MGGWGGIGGVVSGRGASVVGIAGAVLVYAACKSPELTEVIQSFHKKIFKTDVLAPEKDII